MTILEALKVMGQKIPDKEFNYGISLLSDYWGRKIDKDEFEKLCSEFSLSCGFEELSPGPLPNRPQKLLEYDQLDFNAKNRIDDKFWLQPEIAKYLNEKIKVIWHNQTNKAELKRLRDNCMKYNDQVNFLRTSKKILEHRDWETDNWELIKQYYKPNNPRI